MPPPGEEHSPQPPDRLLARTPQPIGQIIRSARQRLGMSQYKLADELAIVSGRPTMGRDRVARWERGRQVPRAEWRRWLSAVLRVPQEMLDDGAAITRRQNRLGPAAVTAPAVAGTTRRQQGSPALLPVFRSRVAAGVLTATLLNPERAFSLTELAEHAGASLASVSKEAELLERAGILITRHEGAIRLTQAATDSPVLAPLAELVRLTYGVPQVVAEEFSNVRGIRKIVLTGTWAERFAGIIGPEPGSIQVNLVAAPHEVPEHRVLEGAVSRAQERLKRPVRLRVVPSTGPQNGKPGAQPAVRAPGAADRNGGKPTGMPAQRGIHPAVHVEPVPPPAGPTPLPGQRPPGADVINTLVQDGQLELISGAAADEAPYLDLAGNHLAAAEQIMTASPSSAFVLVCQAAQLVGSALLAGQGLRPTPGSDTMVVSRAVTAQFGTQFGQIEVLRRRSLVLNTPIGRDNRVTADDVAAHLPAVRTMLSSARDLVSDLALFA